MQDSVHPGGVAEEEEEEEEDLSTWSASALQAERLRLQHILRELAAEEISLSPTRSPLHTTVETPFVLATGGTSTEEDQRAPRVQDDGVMHARKGNRICFSLTGSRRSGTVLKVVGTRIRVQHEHGATWVEATSTESIDDECAVGGDDASDISSSLAHAMADPPPRRVNHQLEDWLTTHARSSPAAKGATTLKGPTTQPGKAQARSAGASLEGWLLASARGWPSSPRAAGPTSDSNGTASPPHRSPLVVTSTPAARAVSGNTSPEDPRSGQLEAWLAAHARIWPSAPPSCTGRDAARERPSIGSGEGRTGVGRHHAGQGGQQSRGEKLNDALRSWHHLHGWPLSEHSLGSDGSGAPSPASGGSPPGAAGLPHPLITPSALLQDGGEGGLFGGLFDKGDPPRQGHDGRNRGGPLPPQTQEEQEQEQEQEQPCCSTSRARELLARGTEDALRDETLSLLKRTRCNCPRHSMLSRLQQPQPEGGDGGFSPSECRR
jgi:hypothetical protein